MNVRTKTNILLITALGILAVVTYNQINRFRYRSRETPRYCGYFPISKEVGFHDNCAVGMRAYATVNGKEIEMTPKATEDDYTGFRVPIEALEAGEFSIKAIDRDGNESATKKLKVLEGIVVEEDNI